MSKTDTTPLDVASGLDHLLTNLPAEVIILHSPGGQIHYASHSASRIFGNREGLQGSNVLERVHADDRERVKGIFLDTATKGKEPTPITMRLLRPESEDAWVVMFSVAVKDAIGHVIELHTTLRDVTAQIALRDRIVENDRLSYMTNTLARVGGWYYDYQTLELFWSDQVRAIHEVPPEFQPDDDNVQQFFSQADNESIRRAINQAVESHTLQVIELPMRTTRGADRWVRIVIQAAFEKEVATRLYGATQDITEIKQREHELSNVVMELSSQQDQLEEYSHILSHHMRAPLTNLSSLVSLLSESQSQKERTELIEALREAVDSLRLTFDEVSSAVRVRNVTVHKDETLDIKEIIDHVVDRLEPNMRDSNATISIDVEHSPTLEYPAVFFQAIVQQLIMNAIRFSHPDRAPHVDIRSCIEGERNVLIVTDNGIGIDLDRFGTKLFKLRNTFHRFASGRGVGLFMVRTIVESLGGEINVISRPGEGSRFKVYLNKHEPLPS